MSFGCLLLVGALLVISSVYCSEYPLYLQCDEEWGLDEMNSTKGTLCYEGCAVTSLAMFLAGKNFQIDGATVTPKTLNHWLQKHDGYKCIAGDCNNLVLDSVERLNHKLMCKGEVATPTAASLRELIDEGVSGLLAHVSQTPEEGAHHFVLLVGYEEPSPSSVVGDDDDAVFVVNDPYYNRTRYTYNEIKDVIIYDAARPAGQYGVDVSVAVSQSTFECLKSEGFSFAIVRCYRSLGEIDEACATSVAAAWAAGFENVDLYHFPDVKQSPLEQVTTMLDYLDENKVNISRYWMDVETFHWGNDTEANVFFLLEMVSMVEMRGYPVGIYTSARSWTPITGDTVLFGQYPLWYARYERVRDPSFADFVPFGSWEKPAIKQFAGSALVCEVDADLNWRP